jgi:hypothetical protein
VMVDVDIEKLLSDVELAAQRVKKAIA